MKNNFTDMEEFPLKSLSNLAIFSQENDDKIYPYFLCANGTSHIIKYLNKCDSFQELYYVTLYYDSLHILLTKDIMTVHKAKMKTFLTYIDPQINLNELLMV